MEFRSLSVILLLTTIICCGQSEDLPRATLTAEPASAVFSGESVTLKCEIEHINISWTYQWNKQDKWHGWTAVSQSEYYSENMSALTITEDAVLDGDQYRCRGEQSDRPTSSQYSNTVLLTVKALPRATLTVEPERPLSTGESVTLKCEINTHAGWTYQWHKQNKQSGWTAVPQSANCTVNRDTLTIREDAVINGDQYQCRGERRYRPTSSQYSESVTLTVKVFLRVSPSRTQHFITDSLSLSCEGQSDSAGWRVRRYTHSEKVSDCSSGWGSVTGSTCNINSLSTSHTGVYWCESESGESSNAVNITVHSVSNSGASFSVFSLLSSLMAVSPYLLVSIVLMVKCYRARAKSDQLNLMS
ncbi:Fc receptor-like protein 3 [Colossoma macropomum]|uniref:Fc receptor-like protein 3 n=1 Tax=Colossoma macropomum TaxID=42526 RepID=UPI00186536F6|nr:Fc receptor-like protein 3 [Colossoma macropomum]